MPKISELTAATYDQLDGAEVLPIVDSGTTKKLAFSELTKYSNKYSTSKPVDQGTVTATPTTVPMTPGKRNLWWVSTASGAVNLSSIGTIGLLPGQSAIFRKTTTDANAVTFTATVGGSGLTGSLTVTLDKHYSAEPREIELVWDGSAWTLVSTGERQSTRFYFATEYGFDPAASAANNATYLANAITAAEAGKGVVVIEPGTYSISSAWTRRQVANLRLIGIGLPTLDFSATTLTSDNMSTTTLKNYCFASLTTGGSIRIDGVKFKGWNAVVRVETDGTPRDYGTIRIENCEFENCNYALNNEDTSAGTLDAEAQSTDECEEVVIKNCKFLNMYCCGARWYSRRTKSVLIEGNIVDGVLTDAPWYIGDKSAVAVVARTNHSLSGTTSIDGVSLTSGVTRVLCVGQTTATQNGIYVANSGSWTRAADLAAGATFTSFTTSAKVTGGSYNAYATSSYPGAVWECRTSGTVGTNNMSWEMRGTGQKMGFHVLAAMPDLRASTSASNDANSNYRDNLGYIISNNIIRNIKGDCGPIGGGAKNGTETLSTSVPTGWSVCGVQIGGEHAKVIGNHVENVYSRAYINCEGIYVKTRSGIVANNTLHNAGHCQGAIAIKGQPEGLDYLNQSATPHDNLRIYGDLYGHSMMVCNNVITSTDGGTYPRWGISIWTGPGIVISNNIIEGVNVAIAEQISGPNATGYKQCHVTNNIMRKLVNCPTSTAMLDNTIYNQAYGISNVMNAMIIMGNTFDTITMTGASGAAIYIGAATNGYERSNLVIANNTFDNVVADTSNYPYHIEVQSPGAADDSMVTFARITGNYFGICKGNTSTTWYSSIIRSAEYWTGVWAHNMHTSGSLAPSFSATPVGMVMRDNVGSASPATIGYLAVQDGMTAPSAATGEARIYADTADGDLKVKFADGTTKTIVVDT